MIPIHACIRLPLRLCAGNFYWAVRLFKHDCTRNIEWFVGLKIITSIDDA
jgi:hypothetical protein